MRVASLEGPLPHLATHQFVFRLCKRHGTYCGSIVPSFTIHGDMERSSLGFHELLVQQIMASPVYGNTLIRPCTLYRSAGINARTVHNQRLPPLHKPT